MSVGRELGHTLKDCQSLQDWIDAAGLPLPLKPMVDIDHGDVTSPNPDDVDPYAWARVFAAQSPIIHIKQIDHEQGRPLALHRAVQQGRPHHAREVDCRGGSRRRPDNELCLELAFREREPTDRSVVAALRESVAYWAPYTKTGFN